MTLCSLSTSSSSFVTFSGSDSNFSQPLDVRSTSDIKISVNVTGLSSNTLSSSSFAYSGTFVSASNDRVISLIADSDCDYVGDVVILPTSSLSSVRFPLLIQSHDVNVSGIVNAGASFVRFSSCPSVARIVDVGGNGLGSGSLRISEYELSLIRAANFTIKTSGANSIINVYTVYASDVAGITDLVVLDASVGASVAFLQTSEWRGLIATAGTGMTINGNITSTVSLLSLDGNADNYVLTRLHFNLLNAFVNNMTNFQILLMVS
jgi:hypothetical protein